MCAGPHHTDCKHGNRFDCRFGHHAEAEGPDNDDHHRSKRRDLHSTIDTRLRLQATGRRTLLDVGWWPHSTEPVAELPGLILTINNLRGPVHPDTVPMLARGPEDPDEACVGQPAVDRRDQVG